MSVDWTVIGLKEPDQRLIVEALVMTMPELNLRHAAEDQLLEIVDDAGTTLLVLELPRLIQLPGEVLRLLPEAAVSAPAGGTVPALFSPGGAGLPGDPLWWQEIHAVGGAALGGPLADQLAHAVAALCNGVVVSPDREGSHD